MCRPIGSVSHKTAICKVLKLIFIEATLCNRQEGLKLTPKPYVHGFSKAEPFQNGIALCY